MTPGAVPGPARAPRALWVLFAMCIAAVTHGSLFPWRFAMPRTPLAPTLRYYLLDQPLSWTGWPDVAGNVLLFMPVAALGLLLAGRRPQARARGVLPTLALGLLFAFALQVLQVFVPGRHASMGDVAWNALGLVIGVLLALVYRHLPHPLRTEERAPAAPLAFALVLLWLLTQWWPLVPRFDWQQLQQALSAVLIRPHWDDHAVIDVGLALGVTACGGLLRGMGRPFHALFGLVALALLGRVVIVGHTLAVAQMSGVLIGLAAALSLQRLPRHVAARVLAVAVGAWLVRLFQMRMPWPPMDAAVSLPALFWLGAFGLFAIHSRSPAPRPMQ